MKDYIIEEEEELSPIVVITTALMVAVFGIGILYQLVSLVL